METNRIGDTFAQRCEKQLRNQGRLPVGSAQKLVEYALALEAENERLRGHSKIIL